MRCNSLTIQNDHVQAVARERSGPRATAVAWLKLLLGMVLLALFFAACSFVCQRLPLLRAWGRSVDAYDLRPSAIYYTDYEASGEAELTIRNSLDYPPGDHPAQP